MAKPRIYESSCEEDTKRLAAQLATELKAGDVVMLEGSLGVGKTTFVRGLLESLGVKDPVRSPTFNLIQTFDTNPPVMHADLYRVASHEGIGLEDYLETHLCLIEWPDRATGLVQAGEAWQIELIPGKGQSRRIHVTTPMA